MYFLSMLFTQRILIERLPDLHFQKGDTLQVMEVENSAIVVQVRRDEAPVSSQGKASQWLASARGSVRLSPSETVDDVRMGYYASKYGINS
jgi:hypothetical protein